MGGKLNRMREIEKLVDEYLVEELMQRSQVASQQHTAAAASASECLSAAIQKKLKDRNDDMMRFSSMSIIGSTANGLCLSENSDIDVVLMVESSLAMDATTWCTDVKLVELVFSVVREAAEEVGFAFAEKVMHTKVPVLTLLHLHSNTEVMTI
jgi:hypothetical protein